jgi:hypothetical protein
MHWLAEMSQSGELGLKDLKQAAIWSAKGESEVFWKLLEDAREALRKKEQKTEDLDQLCYALGWGLYWYQYEMGRWKYRFDEQKAFANRCLDYYCYCVELQQESIFTFLWFWNRTTVGVKGPGQMIAEIVWE